MIYIYILGVQLSAEASNQRVITTQQVRYQSHLLQQYYRCVANTFGGSSHLSGHDFSSKNSADVQGQLTNTSKGSVKSGYIKIMIK